MRNRAFLLVILLGLTTTLLGGCPSFTRRGSSDAERMGSPGVSAEAAQPAAAAPAEAD